LINNYTFGEKTKKSNLSEEEKSELLKNLLQPNQLVLPYITRDISKLEVGDVLVGAGHKLSFFVKHPYKGKMLQISTSID